MYIQYRQQGLIGVITLDRPTAHNALCLDMLGELGNALDGISPEDTRCLILTGAGNEAFVAGADIGDMLPLTKEQAKVWSERGNAVVRKLELLPVPVIAAIGGFPLAGGCELALACDIRIASKNASFGQPEVTLGITAGFGGTQRLPRIVGQAMAKELLYTGFRINAEEALRIGLVNHVYPQNTLMEEALKLAERIARSAPLAVRETKNAIQKGMDANMDEALAIEAELFSTCFETLWNPHALDIYMSKGRKARAALFPLANFPGKTGKIPRCLLCQRHPAGTPTACARLPRRGQRAVCRTLPWQSAREIEGWLSQRSATAAKQNTFQAMGFKRVYPRMMSIGYLQQAFHVH